MTFFGFPKVKWLHLTVEVDKCVKYSCRIFSGHNVDNTVEENSSVFSLI